MIISKNQLVSNITNEISDNSTGEITPYDIRHNLLDLIDSVHNLITDKNLNAENISTPDIRTTKLGVDSIINLDLNGYYTTDNTAIGYSSLKSNYQGERNTAIGSQSLSCNIYGTDNVGVGVHSLAGNTLGFGNVGIGNYSLNGNRLGNFNIAIGHAAGYYVDKNTNYKFIVASHNIDSEYICDNPEGSGLNPLLYGELSSGILGVNVRDLHNDGKLQVSGNITPSNNDSFSLGTSNYKWRDLYLSNSINFNNKSISFNEDDFKFNSNLLPVSSVAYNLGSEQYKWLNGHINNLFVSGIARINSFVATQQAHYLHKTINLASSGFIDTLDGGGPTSIYDYFTQTAEDTTYSYLTTQELLDAGIILKASGADYKFTFYPNDTTLSCLESDSVFSRSSWKTNVSLQISSGCHLQADRIINSGHLSLVTYPYCYGIRIDKSNLYFSKDNIFNIDPSSSSGNIAGIGNINFISNSGSLDDYNISFSALESGVNISQKFISSTKYRVKDAENSNKDKLHGFELKYYDDSDIYISGPKTDRFAINSYDNTSKSINSLIILKNSSDGGVFGINSFDSNSDLLLPNTIFNVRSKSDAIARITAENEGSVESAVQLLGSQNCLQDGFEIVYRNVSGITDFNAYKDSGVINSIRIDDNYHIGFYNSVSGSMSDMLTLGDAVNTNAVIALHQFNSNPSHTEDYGKFFVKPKVANNQWSSLYFMDVSGNIFDLILNKYNGEDGLLFCDSYRNTFGGINAPDIRSDLTSLNDNTSIGYQSAALLTTGSNNSIYGSYAGSGLTTGNNNISIGYKSLLNCSGYISNNIVIGTNSLGQDLSTDYNLLIGADNSSILMSGLIGPTNNDKKLVLPSYGKLAINSLDNSESLYFTTNNITVIDYGGSDYPENELLFKFQGNNTSTLFKLSHTGVPLSNATSYVDSGRPFAELNGDFKIRGDIRFADGTSLHSASFLSNVTTLESGVSGINYKLDNLLIEGNASQNISPATDINTPTSGLISLRSGGSEFIINRDKYLQINTNDYIIAIKIGDEYRPLWASSEGQSCA